MPASRSRIAPKTLGESKRGKQSHSTLPPGATSAQVCQTDSGTIRAIDFMPPRGEAPDIVRIVEGLDGDVPMHSELVIRYDYGHIVPWVQRVGDARIAIAGPDALCFRTPAPVRGENLTT